jgi:hypothetical protein
MGSFDCYCALCSGPLALRCIQFGSNDPNTTATTERKIENKRRRLQGEDVLHEESEEWEVRERARRATGSGDEEVQNHEADNASRGQNRAQERPIEDGTQKNDYGYDSDNLSQTSDLDFSSDHDFFDDVDLGDTFSMRGYCGLTRADVQWLDRSRVLTINPEIEETKKAFLSGRGRYDDYVSFIDAATSRS